MFADDGSGCLRAGESSNCMEEDGGLEDGRRWRVAGDDSGCLRAGRRWQWLPGKGVVQLYGRKKMEGWKMEEDGGLEGLALASRVVIGRLLYVGINIGFNIA
ncbi:hypothetical protein Dimus_015496, partial [Dionaea muscipula]